MNTLNTLGAVWKYCGSVVAPTTPTGLAIIAQSTTQIVASFNSVAGATSYQLKAVNGGNTYTSDSASTTITITGIPSASPPLAYDVSVKAINSGGSSSFSSTITVYMIDANMVGTITATSSTVLWSAVGSTNVSSVSSVQSGSAYIDRTNTGGLQLGNATTSKRTFLDLVNLTNSSFRSKDATFYMKFKMMANTVVFDRAFTFTANYNSANSGGQDSYFNLALQSLTSTNSWNVAIFEGTTQIGTYGSGDGHGSYAGVGTIYHFFMVFKSNSTQTAYIYADGNSTASYTWTWSDTSSTLFANFTKYGISHSQYSDTICSNITLYYCNLLPVALSAGQTQNIATGTMV